MESVKELLDSLNSFFTEIGSQLEEKKREFGDQLNNIENQVNLDMDNMIKTVQEREIQIKELNSKVDENSFNESNYTKVSFIKQQDKEIQELRNKVEVLELRNNALNKRLKESSKKEVEETPKEVEETPKEVEETPKEVEETPKEVEEPKPKPKPKKGRKTKTDKDTTPKKRGRKKKKEVEMTIETDDVENKEDKEDKEYKEDKFNGVEPITNPDLEDLDMTENDGVDFYFHTKTFHVYEFANEDGDVGNIVGILKNDKIEFF
jgi:hypothetical protein